ncbi:MAG: alpha/beta hydrolase [Acholeplasmatales bacterium]|jgi:pimeloyl-ACP methyl ester carboxylesterase|nr:alpha/beta hydrolase [Acholeplasmatales bacterium]
MLVVYIGIGIIFLLLILLFLLSYGIHRSVFKKRYEPDGIIQYYTIEDFTGLTAEAIEIPTKKGILRGFIYSYPNQQSKNILIFAHGMWGSHSAYVQDIAYMASQGFNVLGFDYYGTERSDGKNIKGLGNSLRSLDEAVAFVKKKYKAPIYVMGHSWGGYAALGIAKYHKDIKGIVAMAPFISLSQVLSHLLPKWLRITIPFIVLIDELHCGRYSLIHAKTILKSTNIPTLIIHSKDDTMIPYKTSTEYLMKHIVNSNLSYYIVEDKGHNPEYSAEAIAYTRKSYQQIKELKAEDVLAYRKGLDYHKMGELDSKVMEIIVAFLKK